MYRIASIFTAVLCLSVLSHAQELDLDSWPSTTDFSAPEVHFWSADGFLTETLPDEAGFNFADSLTILSGGDQVTEDVTIGGKTAKRANMIYFNVADELFFVWPDFPVVDVLVQYFANAESKREDVGFLKGPLGNLQGEGGFPLETVSDEYKWHLFRLDNSGGWLGDSSNPNAAFGGVNGGTLRIERVDGVIFRAVAIGSEGAFGEPEDINSAGGGVEFDPDQFAIAAEWDPNAGITDGLDLYVETGGDQESILSDGIGPADDQRTAVRPAMDMGSDDADDIYLNWEILDEHFGPTSQPSLRMKIVCEYYDDPALAGAIFGPQAYVTAGGDIVFYPEDRREVLDGTGTWREAEFFVTDVKFDGVNVNGQAGPRFEFSAPVYISRMRMGVIRTSGVNEGVDPIPDSYPFDPDPYGIYAELNIDTDEKIGLDFGNNGGDQEYFIEEGIGPSGDQRRAIRPALGEGSAPFDRYMNFAIVDEIFGPSDQPNAVFKVAVDYYDDPDLAGAVFGPEVYQSNVLGSLQFQFFPEDQREVLEGSGEWRTAGFLIEDMNFTGVNVGPQGAARFWFSDEAAVYISRVRYAVIRPVGEFAGVDELSDVETNVKNWSLY